MGATIEVPTYDYCSIELVAVAEGEEDWRAAKIKAFTEAALEIAFVTPVKEAEVATVDDEPWRTSVGLDHIAKLWMSILETCRWM